MAALSTIAIVGTVAAVGAGIAAGATDDVTTEESTVDVGPETATSQVGGRIVQEQALNLESLLGQGFGDLSEQFGDIRAARDSQAALANQFEELARTGGLPGAQDIAAGQRFARESFAGQRVALGQRFEDASTQSARQRAVLGRSGSDPILQARLATAAAREEAILGGQERGVAANIALQLPGQRVGFASQALEIRGQRANAAIQNRLALLDIGATTQDRERKFALAKATRTKTTTEEGSFGAAVAGGLSGLSSGLSAGTKFGAFGGGGQDISAGQFQGAQGATSSAAQGLSFGSNLPGGAGQGFATGFQESFGTTLRTLRN